MRLTMKNKIVSVLFMITLLSCSVKTHRLMSEEVRPCLEKHILTKGTVQYDRIETYLRQDDEVKAMWYRCYEGEASIEGSSAEHLYLLIHKNKGDQSKLFDLGYFDNILNVDIGGGSVIVTHGYDKDDSGIYLNYYDGSSHLPQVEDECLKYLLEGLTPESILSFDYSNRPEDDELGIRLVLLHKSDTIAPRKRYAVYVVVANFSYYPVGKVDYLGTFDKVDDVRYDTQRSILSFDYVLNGSKGELTYDAKKWYNMLKTEK